MKEETKINFREIMNVKQSFDKITTQDIDIDIACDIERSFRSIIDEIKTFETLKDKLLRKYGDFNGQQYILNPKLAPTYGDDVNKLLDKEIEIEYERIPLSILKAQKIKLSGLDIHNLREKFLLMDSDTKEQVDAKAV